MAFLSFYNLYGYRAYQPTSQTMTSCGFSKSSDSINCDDITHVTCHKDTFSQNCIPEIPPNIKERALVHGEHWCSRIRIFDTAHRIPLLFSLSIIPTHPEKAQTWYYKKIMFKDERLAQGYPYYKEHEVLYSNANGSSVEDNMPKWHFQGFLKPFETYDSPRFSPAYENDFRKKYAIYLSSVFDADASINILKPKELAEKVRSIVQLFFADTEAKALGLLLLQPNQNESTCVQLIFEKGTVQLGGNSNGTD